MFAAVLPALASLMFAMIAYYGWQIFKSPPPPKATERKPRPPRRRRNR